MARVLLTSVVRPFGGPGEGDSVGAELFHAQVTRAQGAFSLRQVIRVWGLDLIAENLDSPTVVLHYPSMEELERELRAGNYTHVGINFVIATFHKVRAMVAMIRRVAPEAKIVFGGYGTILPDEMLTPLADYVCREEGVRFMRRLLGEQLDLPIRAAHSPVPSNAVLGHQQDTVVGHVTAGLGCANGCDFCCTSHFFKRRYVPLRGSGSDVYDAMMETKRRAERDGYSMSSFALIDEDFFLQKRRAHEFLEAVRRGGKPLSIFGFGSVKGLSQFTASEIAEMGFDLIWTAFEGKRAGFAKLDGRPIAELYDDLRRHGTAVLSSMIIGFPYQDEATIRAEFDELMKLEPALAQILIYFAFPGTPFFEQVIREGRFRDEYAKNPDLRRWDGFALHLKHPHFSPESLERLQRELYAEDYRRLGPSVHRLARTWLRGAEHLAGAKSALLRARGDRLGRDARAVMPTFGAAEWLLPSREAKLRARELKQALVAHGGAMTARERVLTPLATLSGIATEAAQRLGVLQQPGLLRVAHRCDGEASMQSGPILALQGAGSSIVQRLAEDVRHLVVDRLAKSGAEHARHEIEWRSIPRDRRSLGVETSQEGDAAFAAQ